MSSKHPIFLAFRSSTWFIVITKYVACFTDAFIYEVIVPVLSFSLRDFIGVPEEDANNGSPIWNSMLLTSFGAAQVFVSSILGHFADKSDSRRTPLLYGLYATAGATGLLYLARTVWLLVLSRFLQDLAALVVYTLWFALLADTAPEGDIGQWMGFALSSLNVGIIIGPAIGGALYDNFGYGSLFFAVFALVGIDVILRLVIVEKKVAARLYEAQKRDTRRLYEVEDQEAGRPYGTFQSCNEESPSAQQHPPTTSKGASRPASPTNMPAEQAPLLTGSPNLNNAEDKSSHPLPIVTLLQSPRILTNFYGAFITISTLVSFDAAIPIFVEQHFGWTSTKSGLVFLFISAPTLLGPLAGKLYDRYPSPWLSAVWFLLSAIFTVFLAFVSYDGIDSTAQQTFLWFSSHYTVCFANTFGSLPLSAYLSRAVKFIEEETLGVFGTSDEGANAQVCALYTSASAAGVVIGPIWTSIAYQDGHWRFLVYSLGILLATIVIPVVSVHRLSGCAALT
ncbi:MFS general substrate transporter [Acephala macrosclerotiorum]|nr:MFS general substrate transporter [Acephala macrosclerotiorum]